MSKLYRICILLVITTGISNAQESNQELDRKKMMERLNQYSRESEGWVAKEHKISRERLQQCFEAFGHEGFCSCLNEELHWVLSFDSYIRIITAPSAAAASDASPDERKAIESVYTAREKCVEKYFGVQNKAEP
jgi:hypothetical protein